MTRKISYFVKKRTLICRNVRLRELEYESYGDINVMYLLFLLTLSNVMIVYINWQYEKSGFRNNISEDAIYNKIRYVSMALFGNFLIFFRQLSVVTMTINTIFQKMLVFSIEIEYPCNREQIRKIRTSEFTSDLEETDTKYR